MRKIFGWLVSLMPERCDTSEIVVFYSGGEDDWGRTLKEYVRASDMWLETTHDWIQWAFPLPEESRHASSAPILTKGDVEAFRNVRALRARLLRMFRRTMRSYGLKVEVREGNWAVVRSETYLRKTGRWARAGDHNLLRLTRIMRSMALLGWPEAARALLARLSAMAEEPALKGFQENAMPHWTAAAKGDLFEGLP